MSNVTCDCVWLTFEEKQLHTKSFSESWRTLPRNVFSEGIGKGKVYSYVTIILVDDKPDTRETLEDEGCILHSKYIMLKQRLQQCKGYTNQVIIRNIWLGGMYM